jgi:hypothetical protein
MIHYISEFKKVFDICDIVQPKYNIKDGWMYMFSNDNRHTFMHRTTRDKIQITANIEIEND